MTTRHYRQYYWYSLSALLFVMLTTRATAFFVPAASKRAIGREAETNQGIGLPLLEQRRTTRASSATLFASKKKGGKKAKPKTGGGGFGGEASTKTKAGTTTTTGDSSGVKPVRADKNSLETQWDAFAVITDLEIKPLGDPEDDDYEHFEVADVFVRSGGEKHNEDSSTGWFRIGKVCASPEASIEAALTLQKGLIFWTAVHMRRELMALGKVAATSLELGYIVPPIVYMGTETDGPMDDDEADAYLQVFQKSPPEVLGRIQNKKSFGFRPDWNPPGFTYKRRENAARKDKPKKSSRLEDAIGDASE